MKLLHKGVIVAQMCLLDNVARAISALSLLASQQRSHFCYSGVVSTDSSRYRGRSFEARADAVVGDVYFDLYFSKHLYRVRFIHAQFAVTEDKYMAAYVTCSDPEKVLSKVTVCRFVELALNTIEREARYHFSTWQQLELGLDELLRKATLDSGTHPMSPFMLCEASVNLLCKEAKFLQEGPEGPGWETWLINERDEMFQLNLQRFRLECSYRKALVSFIGNAASCVMYIFHTKFEGMCTEIVSELQVLKCDDGLKQPCRVVTNSSYGKPAVLWNAHKSDITLDDLQTAARAKSRPTDSNDSDKCAKYNAFFSKLVKARGDAHLTFAACGSKELRASAVLYGGVKASDTAPTEQRTSLQANSEHYVVITDASGDSVWIGDIPVCTKNWIVRGSY